MNEQPNDIAVWENIEAERSAGEAKKYSLNELKISDSIIQRYIDPANTTPFPLEYVYHLLGDVRGKLVLDYGCGAGENSVLIASHGGKPIGVDISADLIQLAQRRRCTALRTMNSRLVPLTNCRWKMNQSMLSAGSRSYIIWT